MKRKKDGDDFEKIWKISCELKVGANNKFSRKVENVISLNRYPLVLRGDHRMSIGILAVENLGVISQMYLVI